MKNAQVILCAAALRELEAAYRDAVPPLMERAGAAAAAMAAELIGADRRAPLVVAGPGNNGGDGFVVARLLKQRGLAPRVVFAGEAARLPADARAAHDAWIACGGTIDADVRAAADARADAAGHAATDWRRRFSIAIDGLFGIGLARPPEGRFAALVEDVNHLSCPVLALDIASGIDSETGAVRGIAVRATHCATFIALKPGLLTLEGPDHCGAVTLHDLGIDAGSAPPGPARGDTVAPALFVPALGARRRNSHKGSFGSVGIVGGAPGMAGAALLAGRAALHLGAGKVYLGMLERLTVNMGQPELMLREPDQVLELASCLAVGPGLGASDAALALLRRAVASPLPLLVDADGLNLLAAHPVLGRHLARREAPVVLTPHPAEAARLLATDTASVQRDRRAAALSLAQRYRASVVLKGCGSVIALADGRWFINATGNPGLASAGSGDVLSGIAIALVAQGWSAEHALLAAVHVHGAAADMCVAEGAGPAGLTAGELITPARTLLNSWIAAARD